MFGCTKDKLIGNGVETKRLHSIFTFLLPPLTGCVCPKCNEPFVICAHLLTWHRPRFLLLLVLLLVASVAHFRPFLLYVAIVTHTHTLVAGQGVVLFSTADKKKEFRWLSSTNGYHQTRRAVGQHIFFISNFVVFLLLLLLFSFEYAPPFTLRDNKVKLRLSGWASLSHIFCCIRRYVICLSIGWTYKHREREREKLISNFVRIASGSNEQTLCAMNLWNEIFFWSKIKQRVSISLNF